MNTQKYNKITKTKFILEIFILIRIAKRLVFSKLAWSIMVYYILFVRFAT